MSIETAALRQQYHVLEDRLALLAGTNLDADRLAQLIVEERQRANGIYEKYKAEAVASAIDAIYDVGWREVSCCALLSALTRNQVSNPMLESFGELPSASLEPTLEQSSLFEEDLVSIANGNNNNATSIASSGMWIPDALAESCKQCRCAICSIVCFNNLWAVSSLLGPYGNITAVRAAPLFATLALLIECC